MLITHDHADHIKSAGCLGEKYGIPVYTTSDILAGMNRSYCMSEKIYSAGRIIHKEVEFALCDFVITARVARYLCQANYLVIEANYDEEMLQQGSYPYYLKKRIFNDHGHMSNAATAEFLANNINEHLRYIFLCHLSRENNHPELAYKTVEYSLYQQGIRERCTTDSFKKKPCVRIL